MTHRYDGVEKQRNPAPAETPWTIESDVGSEVYQELLASFLLHLSLQLIELNDAAALGDVPGAQYVAHQIKGTAPSFGAARLDELAQRVLGIDSHQVGLLRVLVSEVGIEIGTLQAVISV